jgi:hypothetical protein
MDINIEQEANSLVEKLDDALESATEEFSVNFTERQYSDWLDAGYKAAEFDLLESEILHRALQKLVNRWREANQVS